MFRSRFALAACVLGAGMLAAPSCDERDATCEIDADCGSGLVCRANACVSAADASTSDTGLTCGVEGAACTNDESCCARRCISLRCASSAPSTTIDEAGAPQCANVYELCLTNNDCCLGLTCQTGACR